MKEVKYSNEAFSDVVNVLIQREELTVRDLSRLACVGAFLKGVLEPALTPDAAVEYKLDILRDLYKDIGIRCEYQKILAHVGVVRRYPSQHVKVALNLIRICHLQQLEKLGHIFVSLFNRLLSIGHEESRHTEQTNDKIRLRSHDEDKGIVEQLEGNDSAGEKRVKAEREKLFTKLQNIIVQMKLLIRKTESVVFGH